MNRYYTKNAYSPVNRTHGIGAQTAARKPNRSVGEQDSTTRRKTKKKQGKKKGSSRLKQQKGISNKTSRRQTAAKVRGAGELIPWKWKKIDAKIAECLSG